MLRQFVIDYVVPAVGALLASVLGLLVFKAKQWIDLRVKNDRANSILKRMADAAADIVRDVSAVEYKLALERSKDGKLDAGDRAELRNAAVDRLKTYMGPKALAELGGVMKVGSDALEVIVASKVEKAVDDMKLARVAAQNATPVAPVVSGP